MGNRERERERERERVIYDIWWSTYSCLSTGKLQEAITKKH